MQSLCDAAKAEEGVEEGWRQWSDREVNRTIVDFLLREDRADIAMKLAESTGVKDLVDGDLFRVSLVITQALEAHSCTEALQWCSDNRAALHKIQVSREPVLSGIYHTSISFLLTFSLSFPSFSICSIL